MCSCYCKYLNAESFFKQSNIKYVIVIDTENKNVTIRFNAQTKIMIGYGMEIRLDNSFYGTFLAFCPL